MKTLTHEHAHISSVSLYVSWIILLLIEHWRDDSLEMDSVVEIVSMEPIHEWIYIILICSTIFIHVQSVQYPKNKNIQNATYVLDTLVLLIHLYLGIVWNNMFSILFSVVSILFLAQTYQTFMNT